MCISKNGQLKFHLLNGAADWFSLVNTNRLSWSKLEQKFKRTFPYPDNQRPLLAPNRRQKPHEDLMTYYHSKMRLIKAECVDSEQKDSLKLEIESIIYGMNSIDTMLALTMRAEFHSPRDVYDKFILKKYQHLSTGAEPHASDLIVSPICSIQNNDISVIKTGNKIGKPPKCNKTKCYQCNKFGHKAKNCRESSGVT